MTDQLSGRGTATVGHERPARDRELRYTRRVQLATLLVAQVGMFTITLDAVIVNIALPSIRTDLGGGIHSLQWVVDGYTLMFASLLLAAGSLSDRIGARRTFGIGLALFTATSAACALAASIEVLVAARFAQGATAAMLMPASMSLINQGFPGPRHRARALALWATSGGVAATAGPVLGGLLTIVDWRLIFVVNVPLGVGALLLLTRTEASDTRPGPFDWAGQVTGIVAVTALTYTAIEGSVLGWTAAPVVTALVLTAAAGAAFVVAQLRGSHPMVPPNLVRSRVVAGVMSTGFVFMIGFYGLPFLMSLFLQLQRGLTALQTGLVFLPMMLVGLVLTPVSHRFVSRFGTRRVVVTGMLLMGTSLLVIAVLPDDTPPWLYAVAMVPIGLSGPAVMPPIMTTLLDAVPPSSAGTAGGLLNTSRQLGGALSIAAFGAFLNGGAGFQMGFEISLLGAATLAIASAVLARLSLPRLAPDAGALGTRREEHQSSLAGHPAGQNCGEISGQPCLNAAYFCTNRRTHLRTWAT